MSSDENSAALGEQWRCTVPARVSDVNAHSPSGSETTYAAPTESASAPSSHATPVPPPQSSVSSRSSAAVPFVPLPRKLCSRCAARTPGVRPSPTSSSRP